jgi:hypothetical protein
MAISNIRLRPTGSAAARQRFEISSAGVETNASSEANSKAGCRTRARNARGGRDRQHLEEGAGLRTAHANKRGHTHVLAALESGDRAQHREPKKQNAGEFVRPDDRFLEKVARGDATKQNDDFRDHQQRRGSRDGRAKPLFGFSQCARYPS